MIRRPPRSTLFPYTSSSDLPASWNRAVGAIEATGGVVEAVTDADIFAAKRVIDRCGVGCEPASAARDRKSTRLNSSHLGISYAVFCLKKKNNNEEESMNNKK